MTYPDVELVDPGDPTMRHPFAVDRLRARLRWLREDEAAARPHQDALPFDGEHSHLADERPDWHGTPEGMRRHLLAGQKPCGPCLAWFGELESAGYATRRDDEKGEP